MRLLFFIAMQHLLARKRQSIVSLMGIVLGTAFFLAIAALMQGSEQDMIKRLVDNAPHITISDEFRNAPVQPLQQMYPDGAIELKRVTPETETRGIRGYEAIMDALRQDKNLIASPVLTGQALVSYAGKDKSVSLNGMIPSEIRKVTTIDEHIVEGDLDDLITNPEGVFIGAGLAKKLSLSKGRNITLASTIGTVKVFKVLGVFRTGRAGYDDSQVYADLKRVQSLMGRSNRANSIIIKMNNPQEARDEAEKLERSIGYKAVSWQEASEDLLNTIGIRNRIMYTVVSAVLIVAAFGIYNVISTVVLEKQRDIAILKAMGFHAEDIKRIFVTQGVLLGLAGCAAGLPLGMAFMRGLMTITFKAPGSTEIIQMPLSWDWPQFAIAAAFAFTASVLAALLPAKKAAQVHPVDILRGGA